MLENKYRIKYRDPRSDAVGIVILNTAAEMSAERARLELHRYVVTNVFLPLVETPS
jgi:hypothetical protein